MTEYDFNLYGFVQRSMHCLHVFFWKVHQNNDYHDFYVRVKKNDFCDVSREKLISYSKH